MRFLSSSLNIVFIVSSEMNGRKSKLKKKFLYRIPHDCLRFETYKEREKGNLDGVLMETYFPKLNEFMSCLDDIERVTWGKVSNRIQSYENYLDEIEIDVPNSYFCRYDYYLWKIYLTSKKLEEYCVRDSLSIDRGKIETTNKTAHLALIAEFILASSFGSTDLGVLCESEKFKHLYKESLTDITLDNLLRDIPIKDRITADLLMYNELIENVYSKTVDLHDSIGNINRVIEYFYDIFNNEFPDSFFRLPYECCGAKARFLKFSETVHVILCETYNRITRSFLPINIFNERSGDFESLYSDIYGLVLRSSVQLNQIKSHRSKNLWERVNNKVKTAYLFSGKEEKLAKGKRNIPLEDRDLKKSLRKELSSTSDFLELDPEEDIRYSKILYETSKHFCAAGFEEIFYTWLEKHTEICSRYLDSRRRLDQEGDVPTVTTIVYNKLKYPNYCSNS